MHKDYDVAAIVLYSVARREEAVDGCAMLGVQIRDQITGAGAVDAVFLCQNTALMSTLRVGLNMDSGCARVS